eukprot:14376002-Alexandrium_andersonii.AAC.1
MDRGLAARPPCECCCLRLGESQCPIHGDGGDRSPRFAWAATEDLEEVFGGVAPPDGRHKAAGSSRDGLDVRAAPRRRLAELYAEDAAR